MEIIKNQYDLKWLYRKVQKIIIRTIDEKVVNQVIEKLESFGIQQGHGIEFIFDYSEKNTLNQQDFQYETGYHDFCGLINYTIQQKLLDAKSVVVYLDGICNTLTGTDMEFIFTCFQNMKFLEKLEISTGGLRAMRLWNEGYFLDATTFVDNHLQNDDKSIQISMKGLRQTFQQLSKINNGIKSIILDFYKWNGCQSKELQSILDSLNILLKVSFDLKIFKFSIYGWQGLQNHKKIQSLSDTILLLSENNIKLETFELHLTWCSGFEAWQATLCLHSGLKSLQNMRSIKNFVLNLGGWGNKSCIIPENLFTALSYVITDNPIEEFQLILGNWKDPLKINNTVDSLVELLKHLSTKKQLRLLNLDLWGWRNGTLEHLIKICKQIIDIRQQTQLQELNLNFWGWKGIKHNVSQAIKVIATTINCPLYNRSLTRFSMNIHHWSLNVEDIKLLLQAVNKNENIQFLSILNDWKNKHSVAYASLWITNKVQQKQFINQYQKKLKNIQQTWNVFSKNQKKPFKLNKFRFQDLQKICFNNVREIMDLDINDQNCIKKEINSGNQNYLINIQQNKPENTIDDKNDSVKNQKNYKIQKKDSLKIVQTKI